MKLLGWELARVEKDARPVPGSGWGGVWGLIREPFAGAWQKNIEVESSRNLLAFSAVYACVSIIAHDISKLRMMLMEQNGAVWREHTTPSPFLPVLRKPNAYQTRIQFLMMWVVSKLLHGNTYVLKERDARGVVFRLHVLDPSRVTVLVTERFGDVFYELRRDDLAEVRADTVTVPASEIIHDRYLTLFHPLIGVSPIYACGASATQGIRIQANSAKFFENMSRPSGMLTAPAKIADETALRLKNTFETNFGGANLGRMFVAGDGLKYEAITIPAADAQLIEQLKWTVEDVARCFRVPLHKLAAGQNPTFNNIGAFNQDYYSQTLQALIEAIEVLLDEGLALPHKYRTELDVAALLRMDPLSRIEMAAKGVSAGVFKPNEAREGENLGPVEGGDTPYMQEQNWPLAQLAKRPPPGTAAPALPAPVVAPPADEDLSDADKALEEAFA